MFRLKPAEDLLTIRIRLTGQGYSTHSTDLRATPRFLLIRIKSLSIRTYGNKCSGVWKGADLVGPK
jgi:hypothetical protein